VTVNTPEPSGQRHRVRLQQILCGVAIALFAGFFWSRGLHWGNRVIEVVGPIAPDMRDIGHSIPVTGKEWEWLGATAIALYSFVVLALNALYIFFHRVVDQLVPAIANVVIGGLLSVLTIYFIASPGRAMCCEERSEVLAFYNTLAGGPYVGLAFAIGILAVGIAQVLVRRKAKLEDASDLP
jgi:hypothetical protein